MTDKERIKMVVDWKKLTPNAFAKKIGYAKGKTIYDFISLGLLKKKKLNQNRKIQQLRKEKCKVRLKKLLSMEI